MIGEYTSIIKSFLAKQNELRDMFPGFLDTIHRYDVSQEYDLRNMFINIAVAAAQFLNYKSGYRIDPKEPEWPVAFIELPTGQVSWHMPQFPNKWDGHTAEQKYARIREYVNNCKKEEKE